MSSTRFSEGAFSEITAQRAVSGSNFQSGVIDYNFSIGSPNVFVPSESYFVIDATLTYEGKQPHIEDQIALANDFGSCLFNNAFIRIGGQDVSSCVNFLPQSSIVKHRLTKTGAWLKTVGKSAYMLEANFDERVKMTALDGDSDFTTTQSMRIDSGVGVPTIAVGSGVAGLTTLTGVNTVFTQLDPSTDYIVINGVSFKIKTVLDNTSLEAYENPKQYGVVMPATSNFTAYRQIVKNRTLGNNRVFIVWRPPVGFFDLAEPMASGDYRFSLNPESNYKLAGVESNVSRSVGTGIGQFDLTINDVKLYIATYKYLLPQAITNIGLREVLVQSKSLSGGTEQFQFTVPPSATGIGFFIQANSAGSNTKYSPTAFTTNQNEQDTLTSYQITYANTTKPNTRWSGTLTSTGSYPNQTSVNTLQQRFHDTFSESGLIQSEGGCESLAEYIETGQIVYHNFVRDSENRSTQCQFSISTGVGGFTIPTKLYLYCFYNRQVEIVSNDGLIVAVRNLSV